MEVDYCISLSQMGETIADILRTRPAIIPKPPDLILASEIAERVAVNYKHIKQLGQKKI
jgi:two-component system chemotaxis response regulator CheB